MKNFLNKINTSLQSFLYGRYGFDELSKAATVIALLFLVLSWTPKLHFLYFPAVLLWPWIIFRCYSRNIAKRQAECSAYLRLQGKVTGQWSLLKRMFRDRKTHRYFRCKCKTYIRVKKGKGKVSITCPKCNHELIRKT